jgi:hypothetical protein
MEVKNLIKGLFERIPMGIRILELAIYVDKGDY